MQARRLRGLLALSSAVAPLAGNSPAAAVTSFTALLGPSLLHSTAEGVSADGSTVVGDGYNQLNGLPQAYRWSTSSGAGAGLGIPAGSAVSHGIAVSANGSAVVGYSSNYSATLPVPTVIRNEAFRWTSGGGMVVSLGDLPGGTFNSSATGISADGSTVVGNGQTGTLGVTFTQAYRWTSGGGMVPLVGLESAEGISADSSIIVGSSSSQAAVWTGGGTILLDDLPGGIFLSYANNVSADGSTVVGFGHSTAGREAFRWASSDGMVGLGFLPGGIGSEANDVSADGSIVVGDVTFPTFPEQTTRAFIWDTTHGMLDLKTVLTDFGLGAALNGWTLTSVTGISDDGFTIVGTGTDGFGARAWVAIIPEPSTGLLVIAGLLGLASWRTCADGRIV